MQAERVVQLYDAFNRSVAKLKVFHAGYNESNNPRECDNDDVMLLEHRRYSLPWDSDTSFRELSNMDISFKEWLDSQYPGALVLPVYGYDHSGLSFSHAPFSCPWDSGKCGHHILPAEHRTGDKDKDIELLKQALSVYDDWQSGDVYDIRLCFDGDDDIDAEAVYTFYGWEKLDESIQAVTQWLNGDRYMPNYPVLCCCHGDDVQVWLYSKLESQQALEAEVRRVLANHAEVTRMVPEGSKLSAQPARNEGKYLDLRIIHVGDYCEPGSGGIQNTLWDKETVDVQ